MWLVFRSSRSLSLHLSSKQQEPNIQLAISAVSQLVHATTPQPAPPAAWSGVLSCLHSLLLGLPTQQVAEC